MGLEMGFERIQGGSLTNQGGSLLYSLGAKHENALAPYDFVLKLGFTSENSGMVIKLRICENRHKFSI